jgi:hypothetical protein
MNSLFEDYKLPELKKRTSPRSDLIKLFVEQINKGRINTKWKPVKASVIAILINQHPNLKGESELWDFYGRCKEAKSFSAYFYFIVKPKKISTPLVDVN